jgi:hypothetical protein
MRLSEFILMNEEEKKLAVLHNGVLVAKRAKQGYIVFLFQMERYYVEAFCNVSKGSIEEFLAFDNEKPLTPYLDSIVLDDLLN